MEPSTRTPEGEPNRCPICGKTLQIEPSRPPGDAPCPHCGHLLWFEGASHPVRETKRQIRALVAEIAQLTQQNVPPGKFYEAYLNRVVTALVAAGGMIVTKREDGSLAMQHQINLQRTNLLASEDRQRRHTHLLYKALAENTGMLVLPGSGLGEQDVAANPTDFLLVINPLRNGPKAVGLVEIFQRADSSPLVQQGYLRFLAQMCELANSSPVIKAQGE
jgi:hypothetical protein